MSYHVGSKNIPDADPKVENPGTVNSDSLAAESINKSGDFAEGSDDRGPNAGPFSSSSGGQKQDGDHHGDVFQPAAVGEDVVLDGEGQSSSTSNNNSNNNNSSGSYGSQSNSRSQGGSSDYQSGNSSSRNNDSSGTTAERAGLVSDDSGDLASTRREENDGPEQTGDVFDPAATGTTVVHDPTTDSTSSSGQGQQGSVTATQSSGRDTRSSNDTTYSSTNVTGGQTSAFSGSNSSSGQQSSTSTGLNRSDSGAGATGVTSAIGKGDAFDRPNASWTTDIGGKRDPGRVALEQMEASNAESNEGRERDLKIDDNNQFSDLGGVTQS